MQGIVGQHGQWSRIVSVLCVVLVLAMGTVQAVHSHPDRANAPHHTCSICSVPNVTLNTADASPVPVMVAVPMSIVETSAPRIFRPATANYVRPPPTA